MRNCIFVLFIISAMAVTSCQQQPRATGEETSYAEGSYGHDLLFLREHDSTLVQLRSSDGQSAVIVSPRYQAKVFTSTAEGPAGQSFGWVHYKAFDGPPDAHMNAYGGENRLWLGPEGGHYSLFFKPGLPMVFDNWVTPAAFDTEAWTLVSADSSAVALRKDMTLTNYAGTELSLQVGRKVTLLDKATIAGQWSLADTAGLAAVGYRTDNIITNTGKQAWTEETGMPCIWILDMFNPSPGTVIVVPFRPGKAGGRIATTDYFGQIPPDRITYTDSVLLFRADGKSRGKLGLGPERAKGVAGSYDPEHKVLTLLSCDLDPRAKYLNQEWDTVKPVFSGDAQNAYNDGPLADGSQMGPFYELESVSPAAMLKPGSSLAHQQSVYHFTGSEQALDGIARRVLGISLDSIQAAFH